MTTTLHLLELPFEVRHVVYDKLLAKLTVHACPDEHQLKHNRAPTSSPKGRKSRPSDTRRGGRKHGDFYDDLMECSTSHYQSLIKLGKWSTVGMPVAQYKASDILHFAIACKKIYLEIEPLLWSKVRFAIGMPHFGIFFERYLKTTLRSRSDISTPRANSIQKLILALPRTDELGSEMGHDLRYVASNAYFYIADKVEQSQTYLATWLPNLRSVEVIMDSSHLEYRENPHQIVPYVRADIETILRFSNLNDFSVRYSGSFSPSSYYPDGDELRPPFRKQLECCERALREMVTGTAMPLDTEQDETGWLGKWLRSDDDDSPLNEFCERVIRYYNAWWKGLSMAEKEAIKRDYLANAMMQGDAARMSQWMLDNQI